MRTDELKKLNEHFYDEIFRRRNIDAIDELLTEDFVEHNLWPGQPPGRAGAKVFLGQLLAAFPDLDPVVEFQIAEGDTVTAVARFTGTHQGEFMGMPATGRRASIMVIDVSRARDGRFAEHWGLADMGGLMAQLGAPPPGAG
jgi:steroid delta-isomerase-like uncharacterized protein